MEAPEDKPARTTSAPTPAGPKEPKERRPRILIVDHGCSSSSRLALVAALQALAARGVLSADEAEDFKELREVPIRIRSRDMEVDMPRTYQERPFRDAPPPGGPRPGRRATRSYRGR